MVKIHISAGGVEGNTTSCVTKDGRLIDTPDGVIAKGFHAGSYCYGCGEQLDELLPDGDRLPSRWYVRALGNGEVWGPMSQAEAESMRDQLYDAVMFDDRIFEPQFVVSDKVRGLILELQGIRDARHIIRDGANDPIGMVCQRACDALILLSCATNGGINE
jgi:hypothetical protein